MSQDKIESNSLSIENKNLVIKELIQFCNDNRIDEGNKNHDFDFLQEFITSHKPVLQSINADFFDVMEFIIKAVKYYLSDEIEINANNIQNTPIYDQSDNEQDIEKDECREQSEEIQNSNQEKNIIEFKKSTWAKELTDMKRKEIFKVNREKKYVQSDQYFDDIFGEDISISQDPINNKDNNINDEQEVGIFNINEVDHEKAKAYIQEIEDKIKNGNCEDLKQQMEDVQTLVTIIKQRQDVIEAFVIMLNSSINEEYPFKVIYILEEIYEYLQHHKISERLTHHDIFAQALDFLNNKYDKSHSKTISVLFQLYN